MSVSISASANEAWTSLKRLVREETLVLQGVPRLDRATSEAPPGLTPRTDGICAVGGDLGTDRLLAAFGSGAFPSVSAGGPLLWCAPDPRHVLDLTRGRISREAIHALQHHHLDVTLDRAFEEVIVGARAGSEASLLNAFLRLFRMGQAHSVECWAEGTLIAGGFGLSLGAAFFMVRSFSMVKGAVEVALATLHERLRSWGFSFVDYQTATQHRMRLGQEPWARAQFLIRLAEAVTVPAQVGRWSIDGPSPLTNGLRVGEVRIHAGA